MQANRNPLFIEDSSIIEGNKIKRGASRRYNLAIKNISEQEEVSVNFWIETTDQRSEALLGWYTFDQPAPLKLKRGENYTVPLVFEIPRQAIPNIYNYILVFEAAQYPENSFRRPLQLQVEASEQDLELDIQPTFTVLPLTTAEKPYLLQAGESFSVTVTVENRSKQTDRFYLTCPELANDWYTVEYPEGTADRYGNQPEVNGLPLNPKDKGEIVVRFHPPQYTLAGNYHPTLQLMSSIRDDLMMLDVVYWKLLPNEQLNVLLQPPVQQIPAEPGDFELILTNAGNIDRHITVTARDANQRFAYQLDRPVADLQPSEMSQIHLYAKPRKWWQRPLWGKPLEFNFDISLSESVESAPQPTLSIPISQGTIRWNARPWWVLALLVGSILLAIAALALYLWRNILRPLDPPEITAFRVAPLKLGSESEPVRKEGKGDTLLRLNWQVKQLEPIHHITIVRLEKGVETQRKTYFLVDPKTGALPAPLQRRDAATGKDKPNNYCQQIDNAGKPRSYLALATSPALNIPYPILKTTTPTLLDCQGITTGTKDAGRYTFQMQVFTDPQQKEPTAIQTTDTVAILPADDPKIVAFTPTQLVYQEGQWPRVPVMQPVNNPTNAAPTLLTSANTGVQLNWAIANAKRIRELVLTSTSPDGATQMEAKRYIFGLEGVPAELSGVCVRNQNLVCRNVPTGVQRAGNYTFKLTAVVYQEKGTTELTRTTEPVTITPKELQILSFQVNGQEAKSKPKHVYMLSDRADKVEIVLSWNTSGGEDLQVELLPSPGKVVKRGSINYSLSPPTTETITLKLSNKFGAQMSQSVVIQTVEAPSLDQPLIQSPSQQATPRPPSDSPLLSPIEAPPQPN